jgi:hypothetical protein
MKRTEWYRRTTWDDEIRADFYRRWQRARTTYNKAQYLRLQAYHLVQSGLYQAAIELLEHYFREFANADGDLALAHLLYAEACAGINEQQEAITHFRLAIQHQRVHPNVITEAPLDFAIFIIRTKNKKLFLEGLQGLNDFELTVKMLLPIQKYTLNGLRAIILKLLDRKPEAKSNAQVALAAADMSDSGLRFHPGFGVVVDKNSRFHKLLKKLAAA